jgi:hypothetical protein
MTEVSPPSTATQQPSPRASGGRGIAAVLCLVLAALLTTPAALAYWSQRTVNDTTRYVATVGPLVDSPKVQAAVAAKVTATLEQQVDVEAILHEAFAGVITERPRLEALVGPLAGAVNGLIETQVRDFLASDAFAEFWVTANTRLQQGLVRVLEGRETPGAVSLQGDQVVLDVSDVVNQVKQRLVDRGLTMVDNLPIPATDRQIVLFDAPRLERARTAYAVLNPVSQWLIGIVALLYVAAAVLSRRRPRMTVAIGVALAVNALLLAAALSVGRQLFITTLSDTEFGGASTVIYDTVSSFLVRGQHVLLWLGLVLVVAGWFMGRNRLGTATRRTLGGGLETVGAAVADSPAAGPGAWVSRNAGLLRIGIVVLGGVILVWGNQVSPSQLFWAVVVVVVLLAVVQVLVGVGTAAATHRSEPPADDDPRRPRPEEESSPDREVSPSRR